MAVYAMGGAYMMAFLLNFAVPAISPRLFLSGDYTTELEVCVCEIGVVSDGKFVHVEHC